MTDGADAADAVASPLAGLHVTGPAASHGWVPGRVLQITDGAAQVQRVLDTLDPGTLLAVLWHARWSALSAAAAAQLPELAAAFPGAALLHLDIQAPPANWALAKEKVTAPPEARRQFAKPVLKSGGKFPCVTLHSPPSLQPVEELSGAGAAAELASRLAETPSAAAAPPPTPHALRWPGAAAGRRPAGAAPAAAGSSAEAGERDRAPSGDAVIGSGRGSDVAAAAVAELTRGAAQFKEFLSEAQRAGRTVLAVWLPAASPSSAEMRAAAEEAARSCAGMAAVLVADVDASKANGVLAAALGVEALPAMHAYREMKLVTKLEGRHATPLALSLAAARVGRQARQALAQQAAGTASAASAAQTALASGSPGETGPDGLEPPTRRAASEWSPPVGKHARSGATKVLGDGRAAHFFPKMPCLRCGCPWWSSDSWGARCLRCGWDCERDGYDDDSRPLPAFRAKWEAFTAAIKEGSTPHWERAKGK